MNERCNKRIVISGCSGGGKSMLLEELARRGHSVMPEPVRIIVREELAGEGAALPWINIEKFAERAMQLSVEFHDAATREPDAVFFDRCILDSLAACERLEVSINARFADAAQRYRYATRIFMAPPWAELYKRDEERPTPMEEAIAEYKHLCMIYPLWGYQLVELPKMSVSDRAAFIERSI